MTKTLAGKVAIVTGVSAQRGIGRTTALKLASLGADLVLADLSLTDGLRALADEIVAGGSRSMAVVVDVGDVAQIQASVAAACERFGGIDILVNNAGTTVGAKPFLEISDGDWDLSYAVNLRGPAQFCRAVIPVMIRRGGGAIVNNASLAGLGAESGFGAYSASKHGLVALTKTIAAEFGPHGIRCNVVCPGFVNTDMHRGVNERLAREGESIWTRSQGAATSPLPWGAPAIPRRSRRRSHFSPARRLPTLPAWRFPSRVAPPSGCRRAITALAQPPPPMTSERQFEQPRRCWMSCRCCA